MKKLLTSMLVLAMGATCVAGLAACTNGGNGETTKTDAQIAQEAIEMIRVMYKDDSAETPVSYQVLGQTKVGTTLYDVVWSVSSDTFENLSDYVVAGTELDAKSMVTIDVTKAPGVVINYTLTATVTVGAESAHADFERTVPAGIDRGEDVVTKTVFLDFTDRNNRTTLDADGGLQVWEQNGIKFTNSGNVADYTNPVRLYKNTTVTIEVSGADILHVDFHSAQGYDDSPYPDYLKESLEAANLPVKGDITVSEDGLTIGVEFETKQESITFKTTAGQCRLISVDVDVITRAEDAHVHNWTYAHDDGAWTHTATCTAEGCEVGSKTESCAPVLNACACGYTYTPAEIVNALFALEAGQSLPGTYQLTGLITVVTEVSTSYGNATFTMKVEGKDVVVFRAKGTYYADVAVGDTATVNGELLDYSGTKEFTQGCSVVGLTKGDGTDPDPDPDPDPDDTDYGTFEKPLSVEAALALASTLASDAYSAQIVYVKGYVTDPGYYDTKYNNFNKIYIADEKGGSTTLYVFRVVRGDILKADGDLQKGDLVIFSGYLQNYKGDTIELTYQGSTSVECLSLERAELTDAEKAQEALDALTIPEVLSADYTVEAVEGVTFTITSDKTAIVVKGNTLKVTRSDEDVVVQLTVTATCGDFTTEVRYITVTVKANVTGGDEDVAAMTLDFSVNTSASTAHMTSTDLTAYFKTAGATEDFVSATCADSSSALFKGDSTKGAGTLKMGSSKVSAPTFDLTFSKNVKKVVITWFGWSATEGKLNVNGVVSANFQAEAAAETFELTEAASTLTITSEKRVLISKIEVYFA